MRREEEEGQSTLHYWSRPLHCHTWRGVAVVRGEDVTCERSEEGGSETVGSVLECVVTFVEDDGGSFAASVAVEAS